MKSVDKELTAAEHTIISMDNKIPSIWNTCALVSRYFRLDPMNTTFAYLKDAEESIIKTLKKGLNFRL
jgi:hypothetical protein